MSLHEKKHSLLIIYLLFIVIIGAGFFLPFSRAAWAGFIVKAVLFLLISCSVYYAVFQSGTVISPVKRKKEQGSQEETASGQYPVMHTDDWPGFNKAFTQYCREFFKVVKHSLMTDCIGLYMGSEHSDLHFFSGEDNQGLLEGPERVREDGLIELTFKQKTSLLEGNLPIGTHLCGLEECEIRSVLTVPLQSNNSIVGVLGAGSRTVDHFSEDDQLLLAHFGELISQMMAVCYTGLRWETDRKVYQIHLEFEHLLQQCYDEEAILDTFVGQIRKLFPVDRFTFCRRNAEEGMVQYVYGQIDHIDRGHAFPLDGGLNGWLLKRNSPLIIPDIEEGRFIRPRYFKDEDVKHGLHSFLGIPIAEPGGEAWGCISLENRAAGVYDKKARDIMSILAVPFQTALKNIHSIN